MSPRTCLPQSTRPPPRPQPETCRCAYTSVHPQATFYLEYMRSKHHPGSRPVLRPSACQTYLRSGLGACPGRQLNRLGPARGNPSLRNSNVSLQSLFFPVIGCRYPTAVAVIEGCIQAGDGISGANHQTTSNPKSTHHHLIANTRS